MKKNNFALVNQSFDWNRHAQSTLNLISSVGDSFESNYWSLATSQGDLFIDFEKPKARLFQIEKFSNADVENALDKIKFLLLESAVNFKNRNLIRSVYFGLYKTYYYLALRGKQRIEHRDLNDYYEFILSRAISDGDLVRSSRPIYLHKSAHDLCKWSRILRSFGFDELIAETIEQKHLIIALKSTIPKMTDSNLSYSDWRSGLGLNTLTLEFGIYYVDHCTRFFDENIELAIALSNVYEAGYELCKSEFGALSYSTYSADYRPVLVQCLQKVEVKNLFKSTKGKGLGNYRLKKIHDIVTVRFHTELLSQKKSKEAYSSRSVTYIAKHFDANLKNHENRYVQDLIRILISGSTPSAMMERELIEILGEKCTIERVKELAKEFSSSEVPRPTIEKPDAEFFEGHGCLSSSKKYKSFLVDFIEKVRNSGQVASMAFTGWRGSELGYSLEDINIDINTDFLDSELNPFRYTVTGKVPKTHNETPVRREITSRVYSLSVKMAELNQSRSALSCLVKPSPHSHRKAESVAEQYKRHSGRMWSHFVEYYPPFSEIRNGKKNEFSSLTRAYERISKEKEIVNLITSKRTNLVRALREHKLSNESYQLISERIPERVFDAAFDHNVDKKSSNYALKRLSVEIIRTVIRPTPHAFRHMWAEAVYRRFDGDVGWAIRSNFKHISQDMWLAYIKDKSHQNLHQQIKSQVVSSLLKNYVDRNGEGYAGAIDTVMRRMIAQTKIIDSSLLNYHVEHYTKIEIENIKSTPWGFCLLRSRVRSKAKCAEYGIPQRSKASPSLCLGCGNHLAMESSVEGILLSTLNDLKVLETDDPKLPDSFKKASRKTIKLALKYLMKLKAEGVVISRYKSVLNNRDIEDEH